MKKKFYLLLVFVLIFSNLPAQNTPPGEHVLGIDRSVINSLAFTSKRVLVFDERIGISQIFIALPGIDIVSAAIKKDAPGIILIQLNNNEVHRAFYNSSSNTYIVVKLGVIGVTLFETPKEIIGDDLYVMTSKYVYVSRDTPNHQLWTIDTAGLSGAIPADIDMDSTQKVWLATGNGLYTQLLTSNTWVKNTSFPNSAATKVFIDRTQRIWAARTNLLYVSTNGGVSYNPAPSGLTAYNITDIGDDAFGNIYVIQGNSDGSNLYYSANGTAAFVRRDNTIKPDFINFGTANTYNSIAGDTSIYLSTVAGLYTSANQGQAWSLDSSVRAEKAYSVAATSTNQLLMSTNVGAFRIENDTAWKKLYPPGNTHLSGMQIFTDNTGAVYVIGEKAYNNNANVPFNMVYKSTDNGNTFTADTLGSRPANAGSSSFYIDKAGIQHASAFVFVTGNGNFLRVWKKQPGNPWVIDTAGLPVMNSAYFAVAFSEDELGNVYLVIKNNNTQVTTIYKRAPGGTSWSLHSTFNLDVLEIHGNAGKLVAGTAGGLYYYNGTSWIAASKPSAIPYSPDLIVPAAHVAPDGTVWAYFEDFVTNFGSIGRSIWHTSNFTNWTPVQPDVYTTLFAKLVALGDSVFALSATNDGIFVFRRNAAELCAGGGTALISNITGINYQWQINTGSGFTNITNNSNYSGTNTKTLSLNNIPSAWYGYQYRCVVDGVNSNVFSLKFLNYWIGAFSTAWENPSNWSCGTVPDSNTNVIINSGTVILNSNTTCRSLIANNSAGGVTINPGFNLTITHY